MTPAAHSAHGQQHSYLNLITSRRSSGDGEAPVRPAGLRSPPSSLESTLCSGSPRPGLLRRRWRRSSTPRLVPFAAGLRCECLAPVRARPRASERCVA